MANVYNQLLEATIQHLEQLKARGMRYVAVTPENLAGLRLNVSRPMARPTQVAAPQGRLVPEARATTPERPAPASPAPALPPVQPTPAAPTGRPAATVLNLEAKAAAFADLRRRMLECVKCSHLARSRKNVVVGVGNLDAELMFVGEAPGADEDLAGEPFVGKAGQLLTKIIQTMGLSRETVYIANILKCRPDMPDQTSGNRKPTPEEMQTCIPFLHEQIDLVRPRVLVALGATAVEGLLGKTVGITRLRGNWQTYRSIPLMPTYHPAYLLRNQALSEKRRVWEDMLKVMEKLQRPISDRQRNYFQKPT